MLHAVVNDPLSILNGKAVGKKRDRLWRAGVHSGECGGQLALGRGPKKLRCQTKFPGCLLRVGTLYLRTCVFGVGDDGNTLQTWNRIPQYFQAFRIQFGRHKRQTRHVATRMREAVSEASNNGIAAKNVYRGCGQFQFVHQGDGSALDDQHVNRFASQFRRQWRYAQQIIVTIAIVDFKVVVFTIPKFVKATSKCFKKRSKTSFPLSSKPSDAKTLGRRVRAPVARCYCDISARS